MDLLLWTLAGYLSGSVMYSFVLGSLFLGVDLRHTGDHNPGAGNLAAIAGVPWGVAGAVLDVLKAAVPVWLALHMGGISGWAVFPVAIAPVVGNVAPPWPGMRWGKALGTTFGVWLALEPTHATVMLALTLAAFRYVIEVPTDGWAVVLASLALAVGLGVWAAPLAVWTFWALDTAILAWRRRDELAVHLSMHVRPRLGRL